MNEPGAFCWAELRTGDVGPAIGFYERVFNWVANPIEMDGMTVHAVEPGRAPGRRHDGRRRRPQPVGHQLRRRRLRRRGGQGRRARRLGGRAPAVDSSVGRFAGLADPHGAAFGVIKLAS